MTILLVLAIMLVFFLIRAALLPDEFVIERQISINRPTQTVYDFIKLLRNSEKYSKWVQMDPNMKKEFRGTDGTVGFVYAWDSQNKNVGAGEQEITALIEGQQVTYEIRFKRPFVATSSAWMATSATAEGQTRVSWVFKGNRNFPMKIFHLLFNLKKTLGNDLQTGLDKLKALLEEKTA